MRYLTFSLKVLNWFPFQQLQERSRKEKTVSYPLLISTKLATSLSITATYDCLLSAQAVRSAIFFNTILQNAFDRISSVHFIQLLNLRHRNLVFVATTQQYLLKQEKLKGQLQDGKLNNPTTRASPSV